MLPHQGLCRALSRQQASLQSSRCPLCGGQVPLHSFEGAPPAAPLSGQPGLLQLPPPAAPAGHQCILVHMKLLCGFAVRSELVLGGEPGVAAAATACCSYRQGARLEGHATCNAKVRQAAELKHSCLWRQTPLCVTHCTAHTLCTQLQAQLGRWGRGSTGRGSTEL